MTGLKQNPAYEPADFFFNCDAVVHDLNEYILCPFCGIPSKVIWVHGHGQCSVCHTIIDECCRGEQIVPDQQVQTDDKKVNNEKPETSKDEEQKSLD